jgi:hypothetical protein
MRRLLLFAVMFAAIVGAISSLVARWYTASFPELKPGVYVGTLIASRSNSVLPWVVVKQAGEQTLSVAIGDVRFSAQRISPVDPFGKTRQPLIIGQSDARLKLTGVEHGEGRYKGEYNDPIARQDGEWALVKTELAVVHQGVETELTRWFSIWQELASIENEIQTAQKQVDDRRQTIDNLNRYVSDGDTLRKTADVRLGRTDSETESARDNLHERQNRLDRTLRDFDLSQRISQEGRLVYLSRETIQRESRWIELTLKLLEPETSIGFDQALERAERVKALKRAIIAERNSIEAKTEEPKESSPVKSESESDKEEEFYGQLQ